MSPRSAFLPIVLAVLTAGTAGAQEPIARIKSAPQDYRGRPIELEGEAVEIRGLSPRSSGGMYRLLDPTDPNGVLVRTDDLPDGGGPFRVRARLSPELLADGLLLLDEIDRTLLRPSRLPLALSVTALGLFALFGAAVFYVQTRRRERHMRLAPPLWLISSGGQPGDPSAPSVVTDQIDYKLHYVEEEHSALIDISKRRALAGLGIGTAVLVAGGAWTAVLWREDAARPSFVLIMPGGPEPAAGSVAPPADSVAVAPVRGDDTLRVALAPPVVAVRPPVRPRPDSIRRPARRDTTRLAAAPPAATVQAPPRETAAAVVVTPVVVAPPPPPPLPAPVVEQRAPEPVPEPVRPDPAAIRRAAETELQAAIGRFVAALAAKQVGTVATWYPAGDARRQKFLDFLREKEPGATFRGSEAATVTEASAEAGFTVNFRWRGDFGVERRKDVRFAATARRTAEGWAFEQARLLEAFP